MDLRECDDALDLSTYRLSLNRLLWQYDFICVMGLPYTGKTETMKQYDCKPSQTFSYWKREDVLRMITREGDIDFEFMNAIQDFERRIFDKLQRDTNHQIIMEGWLLSKSSRQKLLSQFQYKKKCVLVFDGPNHLIHERGVRLNKLNLTKEELMFFISEKRSNTEWPKKDDGWDAIYYISTFGDLGIDHLFNTCYMREG